MGNDPYGTLGVDQNASQDEIKKAYRKLSKKYHPDINHEPGAEDKYKEIQEAYETLGDEQKRANFDQYGSADGPQGFGGQGFGGQGFGGFGGDFSDIFGQMFGGGGARRDPNAPQQGSDLRYSMDLTFEEAVFGKVTNIKYNRDEECQTCHGSGAKPGSAPVTCHKCGGAGVIDVVQDTPFGRIKTQQTCDVCHGTGKEIKEKCPTCGGVGHLSQAHEVKVTVPAGVEDGQQMRLNSQGEAGINGGPYGDLYVVFNVAPSAEFKRNGTEIYSELAISFVQAALGDEVLVKTVHGNIKMKIPAGTQTGTSFRLKGKGAPRVNGHINGDQHVEVKIQVPKSLNKGQKEALKAFAIASGDKAPKTGFFK